MSFMQYNFNPLKFEELRKYYAVLNIGNKIYNLRNNEIINNCLSDKISRLPNELWKSDLNILEKCCSNGNFTLPFYYKLREFYDNQTVSGLFVFCKVFIYYKKN